MDSYFTPAMAVAFNTEPAENGIGGTGDIDRDSSNTSDDFDRMVVDQPDGPPLIVRVPDGDAYLEAVRTLRIRWNEIMDRADGQPQPDDSIGPG